jgi:hypothetical protein
MMILLFIFILSLISILVVISWFLIDVWVNLRNCYVIFIYLLVRQSCWFYHHSLHFSLYLAVLISLSHLHIRLITFASSFTTRHKFRSFLFGTVIFLFASFSISFHKLVELVPFLCLRVLEKTAPSLLIDNSSAGTLMTVSVVVRQHTYRLISRYMVDMELE